MPSRSSNDRHRRSATRNDGFTLIELLVVLVLIGIITAGFATNLQYGENPQETRVERELDRLGTLMELNLDDAVFQSREYGLQVTLAGYRLLEAGPEAWQAVSLDNPLRTRTFPEEYDLELTVAGELVSLDNASAGFAPQILLMSSGEMTPFELRIRHEGIDKDYTLSGNFAGQTEIASEERL